MLDFDNVKKPPCWKPSKYSWGKGSCHLKMKRGTKGVREKCKKCEFKNSHDYLMKHDEEYAELDKLMKKTY